MWNMKKYKLLAPVVAIILVLASFAGCSPQIDESAANAAKSYYNNTIIRQDFVTSNGYCAFDKVALTEEIYKIKAESEGITLDEYLRNLAEKRNITDKIDSVADYLRALSTYYINKNVDTYGEAYFSPDSQVVEFRSVVTDEIKTAYDNLVSKYSADGIDFSKYLNYSDISEGMQVTVGEDGNNTIVLLVKINGSWKFLA